MILLKRTTNILEVSQKSLVNIEYCDSLAILNPKLAKLSKLYRVVAGKTLESPSDR
jgi:hypothetical protein